MDQFPPRIPEPTSPFATARLDRASKELLLVQRQLAHALQTGDVPTQIECLITLGYFDAAIGLGSREAAAIKGAMEQPDERRCECVHAFEDDKGNVQRGKNYLSVRPSVWSTKHGKPVPVRRCHLCGHMQVIDGEIDDAHAAIDSARQSVDKSLEGVRRDIKDVNSTPDAHKTFRHASQNS